MRIVLLSTYELGHQPFGLASPAAWLQKVGAQVICVDLAVQQVNDVLPDLERADLIAFYLPMHTATRLAIAVIKRVKQLNPSAHLCAYGLYAPVNAEYLGRLGVVTILGGEFEQGLVDLYTSLTSGKVIDLPLISLARQHFVLPRRDGLPALSAYAFLDLAGERRQIGYTEATRGCKHTCRHCPVVPVYDGRFRVIQAEVVLADVAQQVRAGAQHITFGDPDFLNGPGHALKIVRQMHQTFPDLSYDIIVKVEHLLQAHSLLPELKETGCLFVTTAVESFDDAILEIFAKGHSLSDFEQALRAARAIGLQINPTFVTFTPWTTPASYVAFLATLARLQLVDQVAPVQYAIRLLIPAGSHLLSSPALRPHLQPFDEAALVYPWRHPDTAVDDLYEAVFKVVKAGQDSDATRRQIFERIWAVAVADMPPEAVPDITPQMATGSMSTVSEDWY